MKDSDAIPVARRLIKLHLENDDDTGAAVLQNWLRSYDGPNLASLALIEALVIVGSGEK